MRCRCLGNARMTVLEKGKCCAGLSIVHILECRVTVPASMVVQKVQKVNQ